MPACRNYFKGKDLSASEYKALAAEVIKICKKYDVQCILHSFIEIAAELSCDAIHMPMKLLRNMTDEEKARFKLIGASCHSQEEAVEAQDLGCGYITAGHIFRTDCKKGLMPRGLDFLKCVCEAVKIPVYGIGGINNSNIDSVRKSGAAGACMMSELMQCEDLKAVIVF